jgi:carbonic anhydrase
MWGAAAMMVLAASPARAGESGRGVAPVPWVVTEKPAVKPVRRHVHAHAVKTPAPAAVRVPAATPARGGPEAVWADLLAGNGRFMAETPLARPLADRRHELASGQHPRAVILTCSDSRVPPELVFDQTLGDLFVVRSAGEVVDVVATGSIEYAVEHLGASLIVVLGHEKCGAVMAALSGDAASTPALAAVTGHIRPAVEKARACPPGDERLRCAIVANVERSAEDLVGASPVLREGLARGTLVIVKALYGLEKGDVRELGRGVTLGAASLAQNASEATPTPALHDSIVGQLRSAPPAIPSGPALASLEAGAAPALTPATTVTVPAKPVAAVTVPVAGTTVSTTTTVTAAAPAGAPGTGLPIIWEGQLRYRYETRTVLDYRVPGTFKRPATQRLDELGDVSIMRTRLGSTIRLAPNVSGYFNIQDARTMGAEGSPKATMANVDLFLAYVDLDSIGRQPLSLRAGRQVLACGDGRLVSGADWGNSGWGYDGARVRYAPKGWQLDAFGAWISEGRLTSNDRLFGGVDLTWRQIAGLDVAAYHYARSFGDTGFVAEGGRKGGIHDGTSGARARWKKGRLDARVEGALQRGNRAGDPVHSWFGVSRTTVELPGAWKPRVQGEFLYATGDRNPTDGSAQRFDPLYWGSHLYQGPIDLVGAGNLRDVSGGVAMQPRKSWSLQSEFHDFTLLEARDAWMDKAGTTLRRDVTGTSGTHLGQELDVAARWDARQRVSVMSGWSHLWIGDFVKHTGGGRDVDWAYLQLVTSF